MATICIARPVYDDKGLKESFAKKDKKPTPSLSDRTKQKWEKFSMKEQLKTWFPISTWLVNYDIKGKLLGDVIAGLTIGVVNIPQGMAFAALTLLPPVFGLYVSFFPVIFYVLMGSCHHQSWGGFGVTAIMSGDAVSRILDAQQQSSVAPCVVDSNIGTTIPFETLSPNNSETTTLQPGTGDPDNLDTIVDVAITITMLAGIMQVIMGLLRLGFVSVYLSKSFIQALTTGAACHVITSQVPRALGITIDRFGGPFSIVWTWVEIFKNIPNINWATFIVSAVSLGMLIGLAYVNDKFKDKLPVPIPMDMIVVVIVTILSFAIKINEKFQVQIVDEIPLGFPTPKLPSPSLAGSLMIDAFAIALVTYAIDISLGKTIADKYDYKIDDNQEMLASGVANTISAPFLCYISGPSLARIWIVDRAGGTTQLTSAINCVLVLLMMLFLGQLLEPLPLAVLAILLIFSLKGMLWQVRFLPDVFKQSKWDFMVWLFTVLTVVFLGVAIGLFASLGFSLILVAIRLQLPSFREEGKIEGSELFLDSKGFEVKVNPKYTIFHMESSLCFVNAVQFRKKLMAVSGVEAIRGSAKKLMTNEEATQTPEKQAGESEDDTPDGIATVENGTNPPTKGDVDSNSNEMASSSKEEGNHLGEGRGKVIIINCSSFNFVDLDGSRLLASIIKECKTKGVRVMLAACTGSVHNTLMNSGQFDDVTGVFYPTLLDAYTSPQDEEGEEEE
ncbi:putative solute carrier family 26 member 10 [Apostichopus japonicus]|uniref:Putative solute carrier family 26 member 10 n=1 Tax=Stichopus japonicus TaxID=307972 RepID=A0A2G8KB47_STIJA|nr:putative solute carrier family 26 member 10 [Apostichopus japonicus]